MTTEAAVLYRETFEDQTFQNCTNLDVAPNITSGSAQGGTYKLIEGNGVGSTDICENDLLSTSYGSATTTYSYYINEVNSSLAQLDWRDTTGAAVFGTSHDGFASNIDICTNASSASGCVSIGSDNGGWNLIEVEITSTTAIARLDGGSWVSFTRGAGVAVKLQWGESSERLHLDSIEVTGISDPLVSIPSFTNRSPYFGEITASSTVDISFDYTIPSTYVDDFQEVGVDLIAPDGSAIYVVLADEVFASSTSGSYSSLLSLEDNKAYSWRPYLLGTGGVWRGGYEFFYTPGGSYATSTFTSPLLPVDPDQSTTTQEYSGIVAFILSYPPFSWIGFGEIFTSRFDNASTTNATSSIALPYFNSLTPDTDNPAGYVNVDFDVGTAFPAVQLMLDVLVAIMWATMGVAVFVVISRLI